MAVKNNENNVVNDESNKLKLMPKNFQYIHKILPEVRQSLRYASSDNFLGRKVDGYESDKGVLHIKTIEALKSAQKVARSFGYDLLIYDAYRPMRAAEDIVNWLTESAENSSVKYYPKYTKQDLLKKNYINMISSHSTGLAVDITLIGKDQALLPIKWGNKIYADHCIPYAYDGSIDMHTSFCFFDESSFNDAENIPDYSIRNRQLLRKIMTDQGFISSYNEWWHYELKNTDNIKMHDFIF